MKYVALLRGINVGKKKVSMEELRQVFGRLGFSDVKTLLNSGNVIFEAKETHKDVLQKEIEQVLERQFGFPIRVLLRNREELLSLVNEDPFKGIEVTNDTRLYVTFLTQEHSLSKDMVQKTAGDDAVIVKVTQKEICSVITITPEKNTTDLMDFLGKLFGKDITTRNWNTVLRLVK